MKSMTDTLTLEQYQEMALATDQNRTPGMRGAKFPMLGLFGEVGSLMAEVKKKQRDGLARGNFREAVLEEFGDTLWYFSNLASRAGTSLGYLEVLHSRDASAQAGSGGGVWTGTAGLDAFEDRVINLAGAVGALVSEFGSEKGAVEAAELAKHLREVFAALVKVARCGEIDMREVAALNLSKTRDRWPGPNAEPTPLFDLGFEEDEQLPRDIKMLYLEKHVGDKSYVIQKCNGIRIGDRLTDNMTEDDGYRFHDIFHLAFAAVLGWSPVTRALFRCKRKSNPVIDEVEDGARAIVIEEGVSTWVFNQASRHNFFEGLSALDYDLLKRIRILVKGFEVERCALWEWERAILRGYEVFRKVRRNGGGLVHADLLQRKISVE